jgi:uncharacterized membrane protein YkvI
MLEAILENPVVKIGCFVAGLIAGSVATLIKMELATKIDTEGGYSVNSPMYTVARGYDKDEYAGTCVLSSFIEVPAMAVSAVMTNTPIETTAFGAGYYIPHLIGTRKKSWGEKLDGK